MNIVTLIGFIAAACTTASFFPQAIKVIRTRDTRSISLYMYIIFNIGLTLWLTYGVMNNDLPIILANLITLIPALIILGFKVGENFRASDNAD